MAAVTYTGKRELVNDSAGFVALLNDAGSGAVDTSLWRGVGSATFVRATAAAARLSTGLWKLDVASGVARSHYLPDLSYGGYLSEAAATQLITPSAAVRDMTNAAWVKVTMTTAKTSVGIDGVTNACTQLTATGANATIKFTLVAAASSRTYSGFIQRVTGSGNIQITQDNGGTWTTVSLPLVGFNLVQLNASVLNAVFGIRIVTNGDSINVDCNQFEAGPIATTPIPAAGTRNADVLTYQTSGNAIGTAGTAYAEVQKSIFDTALVVRILDLDSPAGNRPVLYVTATSKLSIYDGTTESSDSTFIASASVQKIASAWGGSTMKTCVGGTLGSGVSFDGDMNAGTNLSIGTGSGVAWNGTVKNVRIYSTKAADATLQSMTTAGTDYAHLPGTSYSIDFKAETVDRKARFRGSKQQPLGGGAAEVLLNRIERVIDVTTEILSESAQVPQFVEFLHSVAGGEVFTFDRYGTIAVPVDPRPVQLESEEYAEQRSMNTLQQRIPFAVRLI